MTKSLQYFRGTDGKVFTSHFPEYHGCSEKLTRVDGEKAYRAQTHAELLKEIKPGMTIYTMVRHVSSSGMRRHISLFYVNKAKELVSLDYRASVLMGDTLADGGGLIVGGCGMDMTWNTVYRLGHYLWPKGTKKPHGSRNGEPDREGGYALKNRSI